MKKYYSLIRACMTSDMNLFKIKSKNPRTAIILPLFLAGYLMFMMWGVANSFYEKLAPLNLQVVVISLGVFSISIMTFMEGIYKAGPLLFNCKDDQLLLSLPIKKSTVLFVRILKFYIFELMFNSVFFTPFLIAYIRWAENIDWSFYVISIIMVLLLPIIPIVISCFIGAIISSISGRFKYKNLFQIVLSMAIILGILYISYNMNGFLADIAAKATGINDFIMKIYYPAGVFAKLLTDFHIMDLLIFIIVNIVLLVLTIFILSKIYFKINSRLKSVSSNKKIKVDELVIQKRSPVHALVRKEINTFFKIPVFIVNAGFALVLYIIAVMAVCIKFDIVVSFLTNPEMFDLKKDLIMNNLSLIILGLVSAASYMTSITNSVISLEGRNINILKSLPIKTKTILLSKVLACLVLTTPVLVIGEIILFVKFKTAILEAILLLVLAILIPLVSHFIGLIINLKYPKLDAENSAEVVKQSASSFLSVMLGMTLFIISIGVITSLLGTVEPIILLVVAIIFYIIVDSILYLYLTKKSVKEFDKLSI